MLSTVGCSFHAIRQSMIRLATLNRSSMSEVTLSCFEPHDSQVRGNWYYASEASGLESHALTKPNKRFGGFGVLKGVRVPYPARPLGLSYFAFGLHDLCSNCVRLRCAIASARAGRLRIETVRRNHPFPSKRSARRPETKQHFSNLDSVLR